MYLNFFSDSKLGTRFLVKKLFNADSFCTVEGVASSTSVLLWDRLLKFFQFSNYRCCALLSYKQLKKQIMQWYGGLLHIKMNCKSESWHQSDKGLGLLVLLVLNHNYLSQERVIIQNKTQFALNADCSEYMGCKSSLM